jgi:four helix bundle protein
VKTRKGKDVETKTQVKIKIKNFRDLIIWNRSMELARNIYELCKGFPKEETYGLASQMKRSAISIPSNIAEGFNRYHNKEYVHFLSIALGSCSELETQVEAGYMIGLISQEVKDCVIGKICFISAMMRNLIKKLSVKR